MNETPHSEALDAARWHYLKLQILLEAHMQLPETSRDWEYRKHKLCEVLQLASVRLDRLIGESLSR